MANNFNNTSMHPILVNIKNHTFISNNVTNVH